LFRDEFSLCCLLRGGDGLFEPGDVEAIGMIKGLYFFIVCLSGSLTKLAAHGQTERASIPVGPRCRAAQISRRRSSANLPELSSNWISTLR
jgi:hypothetical protein